MYWGGCKEVQHSQHSFVAFVGPSVTLLCQYCVVERFKCLSLICIYHSVTVSQSLLVHVVSVLHRDCKRLRTYTVVLLIHELHQLASQILKAYPSFLSLAAKSCPAPPGWNSSGDRVQQEFRVGQSVRVTCPKGQQVKGSGTITCRSDQTWSPISSVCERRYCYF